MVFSPDGYVNCQKFIVGDRSLLSQLFHSLDSSKVASSHGDHNINVTDLRTNKCISTLTGHPRTPWCIAFHPHRNDILASGCLGGQVRVWDLSVRPFCLKGSPVLVIIKTFLCYYREGVKCGQ